VEFYQDKFWVCCHFHFCFNSVVSWLWKYDTLTHQTFFVDDVFCLCLISIQVDTDCLSCVSSLKLNRLWWSLVLDISIKICFRSIIWYMLVHCDFLSASSLSKFLTLSYTENLYRA
jgi:hypothetical protein